MDILFEYLFFVEKKEEADVKFESPLNYIGSKAKMITPETPLPQAAINTALLSLGLSRELSIMELSKAMAFCLLFHAN